MEQHLLLKLFDDGFTFCVVGLLQVASDIIDSATIGNGDHDTFIHLSLFLIDTLDNRPCHLADMFRLTVEVGQCSLEGFLCQIIGLHSRELLFGEWYFHSKEMQEFLLATLVVVALNDG